MGMQLNIQSDDACALATELTALTGESLTAAVTEALRERLERQRRAREKAERVERIMALAREIRAHMTQPVSSSGTDEPGDEHGFRA
jgi:antitoxin VapB